MKLRECIKRILIFSLTFILGVFAAIKVVQLQESKTAELYLQIESIQRSQPEFDSDPELAALKEKKLKLYQNRCRVDFEECSYSGISVYEARTLLEEQHIVYQIDLIKRKKEGFNQKIIKAGESRLKDFESALKKVKNEIKKFERDVVSGRIDRNTYNRSLIYYEKCIQK